MPFFKPLNIFNSYLIKEFNIYGVDDKIIKDAFKDTLSFIDFLGYLLKK